MKVVLALANKQLEDALKAYLPDPYQVTNVVTRREGLLEVMKTAPNTDIVLLWEGIEGKIGITELVYELRTNCPTTRIIFLSFEREVGDVLLSTIVGYGVWDILVGSSVNVRTLIQKITTPSSFADAAKYQTRVHIDEKTKEKIFEIKIIERDITGAQPAAIPPQAPARGGFGLPFGLGRKEVADEPVVSPAPPEPLKTANRQLPKVSFEEEVFQLNDEEDDQKPPVVTQAPRIKPTPPKRTPVPVTSPVTPVVTPVAPVAPVAPPVLPPVDVSPPTLEPPLEPIQPKTPPKRTPPPAPEPIQPIQTPRAHPTPQPQPQPIPVVQTPVAPVAPGRAKILSREDMDSVKKPLVNRRRAIDTEIKNSPVTMTMINFKGGVGTTTAAFNLAVDLAIKGNKVLYLELNDQSLPFTYSYHLDNYLGGLEGALNSLSVANKVGPQDFVIRMKQLKASVRDDILAKQYAKYPDTLDFLAFSHLFVTEGQGEYRAENLKDLIVGLLLREGYQYVLLDVGPQTHPVLREEAIRSSKYICPIFMQDMLSIGETVRHLSYLHENVIDLGSKVYPVMNRYDSDCLSEKSLRKWLNNECSFKIKTIWTIPDVYKPLNKALEEGLPLILHKPPKDFSNALNKITYDLKTM